MWRRSVFARLSEGIWPLNEETVTLAANNAASIETTNKRTTSLRPSSYRANRRGHGGPETRWCRCRRSDARNSVLLAIRPWCCGR